jgi:ABC-2 type transport system ATP-binding protein
MVLGVALGFAAIFVVLWSALKNAFLIYGLAFLAAFVIVTLLLVFVPPLFKDSPVKKHKGKLANRLSEYFSSKETKRAFLHQVLVILLNVFFIVCFLWGHDYLEGVEKLTSDFMSPFSVAMAALLNCWNVAAVMLVVVAQFLRSDAMRGCVKWIASPILLLEVAFLPFCLEGYGGDIFAEGFAIRCLLISVQIGVSFSFATEQWFINPSPKVSKSLSHIVLVALTLILLSTINCYLPKNLFGSVIAGTTSVDKFTPFHRYFLYTAFILPMLYYYIIYPFDLNHRRALLFILSSCALFSYAATSRIEVWTSLNRMPLHICNTAMYIMPFTLGLKATKLFYFTIFINVIGAFFAMLMPNYDYVPIFTNRIIQFWTNHWYAFFMPVLVLLLRIFPRPKMKHFGYSMIAFLIYFLFVWSVNTYYTVTGIDPDINIFFLNTDWMADKLGEWAERIFNADIVFRAGGYTWTIRPLYISMFYLIYVGLAFAMWFVYELLFKVVDSLDCIRDRSFAYRAGSLEFAKLQESRRVCPMENNEENDHSPHLTIEHFAKRYGSANHNAVDDFSIDLSGGKIYGFLGKNGAGKSTIIKAIVGMHGFNAGSISVCGYDVVHESVKAKEQIGFVPDNYALYENLTGREYINYVSDIYGVSKEDREKRIADLLKRLEMTDHFDSQMKTYSHGMKQKITIMGALVHDPKLWILDEPMTGVDPNSIFQIKECMRDHAKRGNIVFFSSHLIDVVQNLCDEIIIIKHGQLVMTSMMTDLQKKGINLETLFLEKTADSEAEVKTLLHEEKKFQK